MQASASATAPARAAAVSVQCPAAVASAACAAGTVVAPVSARSCTAPAVQVTSHQAGQQQDQAGPGATGAKSGNRREGLYPWEPPKTREVLDARRCQMRRSFHRCSGGRNCRGCGRRRGCRRCLRCCGCLECCRCLGCGRCRGCGGCRFGHGGGALATEAAGLGGSVRASSLTRDGIAWPRLPLVQIRCHHKSSDYL